MEQKSATKAPESATDSAWKRERITILILKAKQP
jgi:hypothetical protein